MNHLKFALKEISATTKKFCPSKGSAMQTLVFHGLPLFQWRNMREKEEAIGHMSFDLDFLPGMGIATKLCYRSYQVRTIRGSVYLSKNQNFIMAIKQTYHQV